MRSQCEQLDYISPIVYCVKENPEHAVDDPKGEYEMNQQTESEKELEAKRDIPLMAAGATADASGLPTKEQYIQGLQTIRDEITKNQALILRAHYHSAFHTATPTELAKILGYDSYPPMNAQYGGFAHKLLESIGMPAPTHGGYQLWLNALAYGVDRSKFDLESQIVMWPDFAAALKELGMV